jgi:signal transduction histidine kinase
MKADRRRSLGAEHGAGTTPREQRVTPHFTVSLWLLIPFLLAFPIIFLGSLLLEGLPGLVPRILIAATTAAAATLAVWGIFRASPPSQSLVRRAAQLQRFCSAIKKAASTLELQAILDTSARVVTEVTGVRGCSINLLDPARGTMELRASVGIISREAIGLSTHDDELMRGKPLVIRDTLVRDFPEVVDEVESLVCVPLRLEERIFGAICVYGEQGQRLSAEIISTLSSLGDVVSLAIAHAFVYQDLLSLSQTKTKFMLTASHELRSPADAIRSIAATLLEGYCGELTERQRNLIGRIEQRARILAEIVSDLLTLAQGRMGQATFSPQAVDLNRLIQESMLLFEERATEKGLRMETEIGLAGATVSGNEELVRSVLTNLVANAIAYTPAGGSVRLRVSGSGARVVLEVSDTGIGIPNDEQDMLFHEFFRASNAKRLTETGTGLGLAIVKESIERCGGTIAVESEAGRGTTFRVSFQRLT